MLTLRNTKKLHLYKNLDTLKIIPFWKILKERNACLLDFDYKPGKKYNQNQKLEIEQTWLRLYDEFFVLRNNTQSKHQLVKGFDELKLRGQILNVSHNYEHLKKIKEFTGVLPDTDINTHITKTYDRLKTLAGIGSKIKLDYLGTLESNLKMIERVLNALQNSYNLGFAKEKKVVEKEIENVYKVVGWVEDVLNRNLPIEDIVCSRWIEYEKQAINKVKSNNSDVKKRTRDR